jgi:hypothetical protein
MNNIMSSFRADRSLGQEEDVSRVWDVATNIDQALVEWCHHKAALVRMHVKPQVFSKAALFKSLICDQPVVVSSLRIPIEGSETKRERALLDGIERKISQSERIKVRAGRAETPAYLSSRDLVARWRRGRAKLSLTDFHFRNSSQPMADFFHNLRLAHDTSVVEVRADLARGRNEVCI